jgi:DNA-binding SARP family transcriptional activator
MLQQEARFLESERLAAYEELLSLEISLANHRRIIPELTKLVSSHPLRETLAAQLMLSLYRSGTQAEALQIYALARSRLREELGIEPGVELQGLHKSVLSRMPAEEIPIPAWPD